MAGGDTYFREGPLRPLPAVGGGTMQAGRVPTDEELRSARRAPDGHRYVRENTGRYMRVIEDAAP